MLGAAPSSIGYSCWEQQAEGWPISVQCRSNPEFICSKFQSSRTPSLTYCLPHTIFSSGTERFSTCKELTSVGFPTLDSFAFLLPLTPVTFLPFLSFCVILWLRGAVMVTAVLLLAITVIPALLCLPQFHQAVPISFHCSYHPRLAQPVPTCAFLGHHGFQKVSVANYNCSCGQSYS